MVIWLLADSGGARRRCRLPGPDFQQDHVTTDGPCPACGADGELIVQGTRVRPSSDDRAYEADAVARCCGKRVGVIRTEVATLFGVREDMAVLNGPWRVY